MAGTEAKSPLLSWICGVYFRVFFLPELVPFNISYTFRVQHEIAVGHILRNTSSEALII